MPYLWSITALWAFSFSLIGVYLSGQVDSYFAVLTRIALASLLLAPFLRPRQITVSAAVGLMAIGSIQIGFMYLFFYQSFLWLSVPEVLLFTVLTPIYISVLEDILARRLRAVYLLAAVAAVLGAVVIRYQGVGDGIWTGFALVQGANLCFAAGQVAYRRLAPRLSGVNTIQFFGWFFIGALPVVAIAFGVLGDWHNLPATAVQWSVLIWLGFGASGLGYLAWNIGATRVNAGSLAVMNNVLIPAGLLVNVVIWNHDADLVRLALGAAIMLAALACVRLAPRDKGSPPRARQPLS